MKSWRVLFVFAVGCGEVKDNPTDAAPDDSAPTDGPETDGPPAAACDLNKPFGAAVLIPNLHSAAGNDTHATLSADEKTIFFATDRDGNGGSGAPKFHIYSASRSSTNVGFGAPALVGPLFSAEGESHPTLTPDGNTVIFDTFRDAPGGVVHIFTSTRANVAVDFDPPTQIDGSFLIMPALTANGSLLYTANLSTGRLARQEKVGNGFGAPLNVNIPGNTSVVSPVTNDDLTIFVGLGDSQGAEIAVTTRPTINDPFPAPTQVVELKTDAIFAEPSWLSPDGCRLYLTYGNTGEKTTLHVATRPQ